MKAELVGKEGQEPLVAEEGGALLKTHAGLDAERSERGGRGRSPPSAGASAPACVEVEGYFKSEHVKRLSLNLRGAVFGQLHVV